MRKKIISIFLIIIFMFNITGCATTGNYYDKSISNKKQFSDEMLGSVLEDLNQKQIRKEKRMLAEAICALGAIIILDGILYLSMKKTFDKSKEGDPDRGLCIFWLFFFGFFGGLGGYGLGGYLYDRGVIFNE